LEAFRKEIAAFITRKRKGEREKNVIEMLTCEQKYLAELHGIQYHEHVPDGRYQLDSDDEPVEWTMAKRALPTGTRVHGCPEGAEAG
jgi:hypothetical protein